MIAKTMAVFCSVFTRKTEQNTAIDLLIGSCDTLHLSYRFQEFNAHCKASIILLYRCGETDGAELIITYLALVFNAQGYSYITNALIYNAKLCEYAFFHDCSRGP